jgi:hypothetical protein
VGVLAIGVLLVELELEGLHNGVHFVESMLDLVVGILHGHPQLEDKPIQFIDDNHQV